MTTPSSSPESAKAASRDETALEAAHILKDWQGAEGRLARALLAEHEENERLRASIPEEREAAAREEREANCAEIRSACGMCKDGVFERDPRDGSAIECEYCGRPIAAIRSRSAPGKGEEDGG